MRGWMQSGEGLEGTLENPHALPHFADEETGARERKDLVSLSSSKEQKGSLLGKNQEQRPGRGGQGGVSLPQAPKRTPPPRGLRPLALCPRHCFQGTLARSPHLTLMVEPRGGVGVFVFASNKCILFKKSRNVFCRHFGKFQTAIQMESTEK
uniref:Uncharacterized protein n=1 Tax=Molossus molossus TaxID=27622 RepID=A0A7J8FZH1_MOLMO|nr:hypothetical protein HJG59_008150 [Molossus molossus]